MPQNVQCEIIRSKCACKTLSMLLKTYLVSLDLLSGRKHISFLGLPLYVHNIGNANTGERSCLHTRGQ